MTSKKTNLKPRVLKHLGQQLVSGRDWDNGIFYYQNPAVPINLCHDIFFCYLGVLPSNHPLTKGPVDSELRFRLK